MTASPSQSLPTTHKLMCLGKGFAKSRCAQRPKNKPHDKSGTHHRHQADLLSDGTIQLDPNQSLPLNMSASPHTHPTPAGVKHSKQASTQHFVRGNVYEHTNICREIKTIIALAQSNNEHNLYGLLSCPLGSIGARCLIKGVFNV